MKLSTILQLRKNGFSLNESFKSNTLFQKYNEQLKDTLAFYEFLQRENEFAPMFGYRLVQNVKQLVTEIRQGVSIAKNSDNPKESLKKLNTFKGRYKMLHYDFAPYQNFNDFVSLLRFAVTTSLPRTIHLDKLTNDDFIPLTMKQFKHPDTRKKYICFFENSDGFLLGCTSGNSIAFAVMPRQVDPFFYPIERYNGKRVENIDFANPEELETFMHDAFRYVQPYEIVYNDFVSKLGTDNANFFTKTPDTAKTNRYSYQHNQMNKFEYLLSDIHTIYALDIEKLLAQTDPEIEKRFDFKQYDDITKIKGRYDIEINDLVYTWKLQENRYKILSSHIRVMKEFENIKKFLDEVVDDCINIRKLEISSKNKIIEESIKQHKNVDDTQLFASFENYVDKLMNESYKALYIIGELGDIDVSYESPLINDANKIDEQNRKIGANLRTLKYSINAINGSYSNNSYVVERAIDTFEKYNNTFDMEIFDIDEIRKFVDKKRFIDLNLNTDFTMY